MNPILEMNRRINRTLDSVLIPRRPRTRKYVDVTYIKQEDKLHKLVSEYQPHTIEMFIASPVQNKPF